MKHLRRTYSRSNVALYIQIATSLRKRIETGQWRPGDKISTIPELEKEFGVARVTIRQAIDMLHQEGLISRQQGRGTFVTKTVKHNRWIKLDVSLASYLGTIEDLVPQFIDVDNPPEPRLNKDEGKPASSYVYLRSIQSRQNEPFGLISVHLEQSIFDQAPDQFQTHSALPILRQIKSVRISHVQQSMIIDTAEVETAHLLKIAVHAPTAEGRCVVLDDNGVAIYIADIIYRGDCLKFDIKTEF